MTTHDSDTDRQLSQALSDWLDETADELPESPEVYVRVRTQAPRIRQRRHRWLPVLPAWPRWSTPDLIGARGLAAAVAVVLVGALLVVAFGLPGPSTDPAAPAADTHIVAVDGSGDYATIADAVEAAEVGDTILVKPGIYVESLVITKDIMISGDGERETIVIEAPTDGPTSPTIPNSPEDEIEDWDGLLSADEPYAILLLDTEASLSGLTFRGQRSQVHASGGSPELRDLTFDGVGALDRTSLGTGGNSLVVTGGATAVISDSTFSATGPIGVFEASGPLIEGNTLAGGASMWGDMGSETIVRANTISESVLTAISINGEEPGVLIEGNTIADVDGTGIGTVHGLGDVTIRGNDISRTTIGIMLGGFTQHPTIEGNVLRDNTSGIVVLAGSPVLQDNTITGGQTGLAVVGSGTTPTLSGNTICDNEVDLKLADGVQMPPTDGDEICANAGPEAEV
jgi:hypothetical protein